MNAGLAWLGHPPVLLEAATPRVVRAAILELVDERAEYVMVEQRARRVIQPDGSLDWLDDWNVHIAGCGRFNGASAEKVIADVRAARARALFRPRLVVKGGAR